MDHSYIRPATPGDSDGVVITVAIDQDHLEKAGGQARQHERKVGGFVAGRDYHANARVEIHGPAIWPGRFTDSIHKTIPRLSVSFSRITPVLWYVSASRPASTQQFLLAAVGYRPR